MTTHDSDLRREHLLATAANVFAAKGFHPTTMRDLARETGMSLAGIYYYVPSKDELLYLIQHQCFTAVLEGARRAAADAPDAVDRLRRLIRHHVRFFLDHMAEMKVLSQEADSLSGDHGREVAELKRQYLDLMSETLAGLDDEETAPVPLRVRALTVFGMMNWIYTWYDPAGPVTPVQLADYFAAIAMRGAAAQAVAVEE